MVLALQSKWAPATAAAVRIGLPQNAPNIFADEAGQIRGFWPELLQAIAQSEGWTLEYVPCRWEQCLGLVQAGELDLMVDVAYSSERAARLDFNQEVAFSSWSTVYVRRGVTLNSILDLDQKLRSKASCCISQQHSG